MDKDSPYSLKPKPEVTTMSKMPLYWIVAAFVILFAALYYGINIANIFEGKNEPTKTVAITESTNPLWLVEGSGLTAKEEKSGIVSPTTPEQPVAKPEKEEPIVMVRGKDNTEESDHIRRTKTQSYLAALNSALVIKRVNTAEAKPTASTQSPQPQNNVNNAVESPAAPYAQQGEYNPSADKDKEAFFARAQQKDNAWISKDIRTAGQPYELKAGMVVPAVMITGINSDLPGSIIAQVSQNIFDSATGQNLLVPQGSRLFGKYDSRIIYGQSRVLVAWNRIVYPDGSAITLPSMPGTDMAGSAGFEDEVNNHYFRIFGSSALMSLIMGGTAYTLNETTGGDSTNENSLQSQMTAALAQQFGQTTTSLLQKNLNIKPTLEVRAGYQFNIVLTKDVVFEQPYTAWR
jgi:type IV secretory pathway VirB10-like protein